MTISTLNESKKKTKPFREFLPDGTLQINMHEGQTKAWDSNKRFVYVIAGSQGGKTCFGPHWLEREIENTYDPNDEYNDYLIVTATFDLLAKKLERELQIVFDDIGHYGTYNPSRKLFKFEDSNVRIFTASATNPEQVESATAKAVWMDELGQEQFKFEVYDAIRRRLSLARGRILGTTTPYGYGWFKQEIYDKWKADITKYGESPNTDIIQFDSITNPLFDSEEYYERMETMPKWKFDLFYRGIYTKPAGLIYDAFDESCVIKRFPIPVEWPRYVGVDFGSDTAAMWYAAEPATGNLFAYREYCKRGNSAVEHVEAMKKLSEGENIVKRTGGSRSEEGWRELFTTLGWRIAQPRIKDLEVGLDRVYAFHKRDKILVFDDLHEYLEEKNSYSRELNESQEPTDKIIGKQTFHLMDAERYIISEFDVASYTNREKVSIWRY